MSVRKSHKDVLNINGKNKRAYYAGGCFWCIEHDLRQIPGVQDVISGYSGGDVENPSYEEVCGGKTGHRETVMVLYNPEKISYKDLTEKFLRMIDPLDTGGQFNDRGFQYTNAIFYLDENEKNIALDCTKSAAEFLEVSELAVTVQKFKNFFEAESYHQNYSKKNEIRYCSYRIGSGRDEEIKLIWKPTDKKGSDS